MRMLAALVVTLALYGCADKGEGRPVGSLLDPACAADRQRPRRTPELGFAARNHYRSLSTRVETAPARHAFDRMNQTPGTMTGDAAIEGQFLPLYHVRPGIRYKVKN